MKKIIFASCAALLLALPSLSKAQTSSTIAQWTFENLAITNYAPDPAPNIDNSKGAVSVQSFGMDIYNTPGLGTNDPDVLAGKASDAGANTISNTSHQWRVRGQLAGNGWSSQAPVGTQGAQFSADTTGYKSISVAFDWYVTTQGEANMQVQYTDDGINWTNVPVSISLAPGADGGLVVVNNSAGSDANSVQGYFLCDNANTNHLAGQNWFTNLTVTISDPLAANNPNFAVRFVNASTGTSCYAAAGTALNNNSGNWRFDNISISGAPIISIAQWTFENIAVSSFVPNPIPNIDNSVGAVSVAALGMDTYTTGTNAPDVLVGVSGDTGANGITNYTQVWRVRAQKSGNGWSSTAPIGAQGAQFSVDTTGFTNIQVGFDWYATTQGEANLQLQYTIDGVNWVNVPITLPSAPGANGGLAFVDNTSGSDAYSVQGYYLSDNLLLNGSLAGQDWFTNLTAVIPNGSAANNPHFAIRIVNASTGASCFSTQGTALNNTSGNWRFDNILITGVPTGAALTPPVVAPSVTATVDGLFTNTFTDSLNWRTNISSIAINGTLLTNTAYVISAGQIVFNPALSVLLQKATTVNIAINSTNYSAALVAQTIGAGLPASLGVSVEPVGPTGNGGTLVSQPKLTVYDQYTNVSAVGGATYTATATGGWSFGPGSAAVQLLTNGVCNFTNLSAISGGAVSGATITFTASAITGLGGLPFTTTNSTGFNIPAPVSGGFAPGNIVVEQLDANTANTTFSMLELNPNIVNQPVPVNIYPVPATQTNGLRQSNSGSTARLANSQDGTLVLFTAGQWSDSTLNDVTTVNLRGCGSFNSLGNYALQTSYTGIGGSTANQARSATTIDNVTFWMGDKGGVYTNNNTPDNAYIGYTPGNQANVRSLKAYNGNIYALQQEGGTDPQATVMAIVSPPSSGVAELQELEGFPIDGSVLDFCAVASGAHGTNIDVIYYIDGTNSSSGSIFKFTNSFTIDPVTADQIWGNAGGKINANWQTANGGDGLAARTNPNGGFDLFYTTGNGSTTGNELIMVHDAAAWNQPINLTATNLLYNSHGGVTLKGVAFAPVTVTNGIVIYPVGKLGGTSFTVGGGSGGHSSFTFSFTSGVGGSGSFTVWGSTNVTLPFNQWSNLGHPVESPAGTYSYTDLSATNSPEFYRVTSP
ncbi:MAG TPA: hypothetical protein VMH87_17245 [Pseudomonadales bacterium]|nr:hypothetical protein [Pseudomonadales bacterium]